MRCKNCGAEIGEVAFCGVCGAPVNKNEGKASENKGRKVPIIILGIAAIAALAIVILFIIIFQNKTPKNVKNEMPQEIYTEVEGETSVKDLTFTVDEFQDDAECVRGILKCCDGEKVLWEYKSEPCAMTELDCVSDAYVDDKLVYFIAGQQLMAFDKYNGDIKWTVDGAGASNALVFDEENIYVSGYYGPNLMIVSKDGKVKYEDNDESYGWVYELKSEGEEILIYYGLPEPGGVKRVKKETSSDRKEEEGKYAAPHFGEVSSTSALSSQSGNTYGAYNLIDGSQLTAWVEGVKGDGIGQRITFKADTPQKISELKILNGYCKSQDTYKNNNRVKSIDIIFPDGTTVRKDLNDSYLEYDSIVLDSPVICSEFSVEIKAVYKGAKYDDTCLSEIIVK